MRKVCGVPTAGKWIEWCNEARERTSVLKEAAERGEPRPAINADFYKKPRAELLGHFSEKCAYCEQYITAGCKQGDIDHFRPKSGVTNADGSRVLLPSGHPHEGYWWLAYDPQNLLPSCIGCNRYGSDLEGRKSGKWDRFPTVEDFHARVPSEIDKEVPLLINPWIDEPNEHLVFNSPFGIVGSRTARGRATIDILDLNREKLMERRRDLIISMHLWFGEAAHLYRAGDHFKLRRLLLTFASYRAGTKELSAFAVAQLEREKASLSEFFNTVSLILSNSST